MRVRKNLAPGGLRFAAVALIPFVLGAHAASSDARAVTGASPSIALEVPATPRQGYRAARGCRGLPGSEATEKCQMLA